MKNRKKFLVVFFICTILISSLVSICGVNQRKQQNNEKEYSIISTSVYEAVNNAISNPIITSVTMSNDIFLVDFLQSEDKYTEEQAVDLMSKYLIRLKDATHAQTAFVVSDNTRRYYSYDGLNKVIDTKNDEHDSWYSIFVNTRKDYDLDVDIDQVNGDSWTVFVNARIKDNNGNLLGVCGLGLSMEDLQNLLQEYEDTYDIKVDFINSEGLVQLDTDTVNIENAYLHDVQYGKEKDGYAYVNSDGEYLVMRYVDNLNWYLVIHGELDKISIQEVLPVIFGALAIILSNMLAFWIVSRKKSSEK